MCIPEGLFLWEGGGRERMDANLIRDVQRAGNVLRQVRRLDTAISQSESVHGIGTYSRRRELLQDRRHRAAVRYLRLWRILLDRLTLQGVSVRMKGAESSARDAARFAQWERSRCARSLEKAGLVKPPGLMDAELLGRL